MTDTSKEAVELLAAVLVGRAPQNSKHDQNRAADALLALLSERDALRKAVDSYSYIGRDGKMVLAKDLEDERDALRAQLQAARDEAQDPDRAADLLLGDDVLLSKMAKAMHDGPLGADDHWFSAARPAGAWCVDMARAGLRALKSTSPEGNG